jgi:hypothetical protein
MVPNQQPKLNLSNDTQKKGVLASWLPGQTEATTPHRRNCW